MNSVDQIPSYNRWIKNPFSAILRRNFFPREIRMLIVAKSPLCRVSGEYIHLAMLVLVCAVIFLLVPEPGFAQTGPVVKAIELQGNRKISAETIITRIDTKEGAVFSDETVQNDIKKLYGIGYFDDIRAEVETFEGGVKLIFIFQEKPTVTSVDFQGNKEYESKDLREKISITPGAIANQPLIADNAEKIVSFYQSEGYWLVKVIPVIRDISDEAVAVTYQIEEGPKVKVKKISFTGNSSISARKIKKVMKTKEWWIFSFLTGSGVYQRDQIRDDIEKIRELYQNNGYVYAAVSDPKITLSDNRKKLYLTIAISEGDPFNIGNVKVSGNTVFQTSELVSHLDIASGQIFDRSALRKDIDEIIDLYMEKGYARADINPLVDVKDREKTVDINLVVSEGGIYHIGRISISGNTKTRDKVIRREIRLDEGDVFNKKLLKRSFQRINNLNFFESVDISPVPRAEEQKIDLNVDVKEKLTGMLSVGGGYSSIDKFMVTAEITQTNLFGKGLFLKLKTDLSSRRSNYSVTLTDPWFMDKPISASVSVYNERTEYLDYDKKATGGSIGFGKEFSEYVGGKISYNIEQAEITNISEDASSLIRDQEGQKLTSSISPSLWRDTRDNYLDPTTGSRNALYTTVAGLGGDNYFVKTLVDSLWYYPAYLKTVLSLRGRFGYATGYAGKELPLYERFYVGGINTIRGLGFGEGGPRNEEGEKIGGNLEMIANAELIFPIVEEVKLKGVLFFDYGGAFDKDDEISFRDMRETAGAGIRWMSPFGPIRLEWGFNLDPKEDENNSKLEFSMGGVF